VTLLREPKPKKPSKVAAERKGKKAAAETEG
jgi:hypothetical protein